MSTGVGSGCGQPGAKKTWPGSRRAPGPTPWHGCWAERCLPVIGEMPGIRR